MNLANQQKLNHRPVDENNVTWKTDMEWKNKIRMNFVVREKKGY
jgi:hypothetical protein